MDEEFEDELLNEAPESCDEDREDDFDDGDRFFEEEFENAQFEGAEDYCGGFQDYPEDPWGNDF